jgi:hypothetical protein
VLREKLDERMRPVDLPPPNPRALRRFVAAVLAVSEDPKPANVQRYLAASRALEESRLTRKTRAA